MSYGECLRCYKNKNLTRKYCSSCYSYLKRNNLLLVIKKEIPPLNLTQAQEEILIGSLLGDGCLYKPKNSSFPHFKIIRKLTDVEYLKYEFDFFKEFSGYKEVKLYSIFDNRTQ